jgi:hypothetical protein
MQVAEQDKAGAPRRFGGLLRQRNFRLLWIGESISGIGNAMAVVGVPLLAVTVLHASTFAVAALTAAAYLPWLVIGLPVAAWIGVLTIGQVAVVALLAGAANVFFATAYQVHLPALVTSAELVEGNAKLQGSLSVATIGGRSATEDRALWVILTIYALSGTLLLTRGIRTRKDLPAAPRRRGLRNGCVR